MRSIIFCQIIKYYQNFRGKTDSPSPVSPLSGGMGGTLAAAAKDPPTVSPSLPPPEPAIGGPCGSEDGGGEALPFFSVQCLQFVCEIRLVCGGFQSLRWRWQPDPDSSGRSWWHQQC